MTLVDFATDTSVVDTMGFPGGYLYKPAKHQYALTFVNGDAPPVPFNQYCYNQDLSSYAANGIREAGIIGTDILSQRIFTLDYEYSRLYIVWNRSVQCVPDTLHKYGYVAASTKGYYSDDRGTLVLPDKNNVPTIPVRIGDDNNAAIALAQIDPGLDDRCHLDSQYNVYYTHIITINKGYFDLLIKNGISVNIDKQSHFSLNNRSGVPDKLYKCVFAKEYVFNVIGTKGEVVLPYSTNECNVFLKVNGKGGESAGGITVLPFPAAQFGGSFLLDCKRVTFDPFRSLVWFQYDPLKMK